MSETEESLPSPPGFRWRLVFAALGSIGMAIIYGLKVNLSVAIVAMLNYTHLDEVATANKANETMLDEFISNDTDEAMCFDSANKTDVGLESKSEDGPFTWSEPVQSLVLGSYFWGYLLTQVPGGRVADLFGGKWVFFAAVVLHIVPSLLSPLCAQAGYEYLILMRFVEGLGGGVTFPAMNALVSRWAPKQERSSITSICMGGTAMGTVIAIPTAGLIANFFGWEAVFYVHGGLATIWCFLWVFFVTNSPDEHMFMSQAEKDYIRSSVKTSDREKKAPPVPWKTIFTSVPVWTIIVTHTLQNFGWYMFLVELPLFMRNGMGFNIKENAGLSCLPFLCNWLCSIVYSNRLDWARQKGFISTTAARKVSVGFASLVPAACLVGVCLAECDKISVVSLMIIAMLFYGTMFSGVVSNHVDIASNYAGLLMGISNMAATLPGFLVPALVGVLTHGKPGLGPWHIVFYMTAFLLVLEFVVFGFLGTTVEQKWNKAHDEDDDDDELKKKLNA